MTTRLVYIVEDNKIINFTKEDNSSPLESNKIIKEPYKSYDIGYVKIGNEFYPPGTTESDISNARTVLEGRLANELTTINEIINSTEFASFSDEIKQSYQDYKAYLTGFSIVNPIAQDYKPFVLPNTN